MNASASPRVPARGPIGWLAEAVRDYERSQFGRPRGPVGWLAGKIMAVENRARNTWAVGLLDVQPTDRVLEIGFGPGVAIEQIAGLAVWGTIAGIDHSATMVAQARRRNAAAIRAGRVDLRLGAGGALTFPDAVFDKALTVNALHLTDDPAAELSELRRVLKPGGRIVVVLQPVWLRGEPAVQAVGDGLASQLASAGFQEVRLTFKPMRPVAAVGAIGAR